MVTCPACEGECDLWCELCDGRGQVPASVAAEYDRAKYAEEIYVGELIADNAEWEREVLDNS